MPVSKDISLNVLASVQGYAKELGKIPGITEKEAAKAAKALGAQLAKAEVQSLKNVQPAVKSAEKSFKDLGRAAGAISPQLGAVFRDVEDLVAVLGPAGGAAIGVGAVAAVGALAAGFGRLVVNVAEGSDELLKAGFITKETSDKLKEASLSVQVAGAAFQATIATLTSVAGEAFGTAIDNLLLVGMALDDFFHGRGIQGAEVYSARLQEAKESVSAMSVEVKSAIPAYDAMRDAQMSLIEAEGAWTAANKSGVDALEAQLRTMVEAHAFELETAQRRIEIMALEGASAQELANERTRLHALEVGQLVEELRVTEAIEAGKRAARQKTNDLMLQTFDQALAAAKTMAQGSVEVSAVLNAIQIALSAAAAGWRIAGEVGPWAWPAAVATWIAGAASAGWAASQAFSKGPTKHPVPNVGGLNNPGGPADRINFAGQGGGNGDARSRGNQNRTVVEVRYRHRHYDDATDDALRRDSSLRRAMRRNRNRSH